MFYDIFIQLCKENNVSPSKAAVEAGFSKSLVTKWKENETVTPSPDVATKISKYFSIPLSELYGEQKETPVKKTDDLEIPKEFVVMARKTGNLSDAQKRDVYKMLNNTIDNVLALLDAEDEEGDD